MTDEDKFMEVATKSTKPGRKTAAQRAREFIAATQSESSPPKATEPEPKDGELCQWAVAGRFHQAMTKTRRTLSPGCYSVSSKPDGSVGLTLKTLTTDKLLRLPDSKSDEVVAEVERFWTLKARFKKYGFAHKRGFLLFGPPGSGKTATLSLVIDSMIRNGGIVLIADCHPGLLAHLLAELREVEPDRQLVVILEDIDTLIEMYGESSMLSVLDGEHQVENVVYLATTNYPENLDGRVINRPSRFDRIVEIGMPADDARRMFLEKKIGVTEKDGIDLVKETKGLSIAHIKELIVGHFCQDVPLREVIARLHKMKIAPKSSGAAGPLGLG